MSQIQQPYQFGRPLSGGGNNSLDMYAQLLAQLGQRQQSQPVNINSIGSFGSSVQAPQPVQPAQPAQTSQPVQPAQAANSTPPVQQTQASSPVVQPAAARPGTFVPPQNGSPSYTQQTQPAINYYNSLDRLSTNPTDVDNMTQAATAMYTGNNLNNAQSDYDLAMANWRENAQQRQGLGLAMLPQPTLEQAAQQYGITPTGSLTAYPANSAGAGQNMMRQLQGMSLGALLGGR